MPNTVRFHRVLRATPERVIDDTYFSRRVASAENVTEP
jgi:hypothetical protein